MMYKLILLIIGAYFMVVTNINAQFTPNPQVMGAQHPDKWDRPEKPKALRFHTFDIRYKDSSEDRVTGLITRQGAEYYIDPASQKKHKGFNSEKIKMSDLISIEMIDDIDNPVKAIKTDSAWIFVMFEGAISAYSTYEGDIKQEQPLTAIRKNQGNINSYSYDILKQAISDNENALKILEKSKPLAAIRRYNEDFRKNDNAEFTQFFEHGDTTASSTKASFIGGAAAWSNYLKHNLRYPFKARRENIQDNVHVEFTVDDRGKTSNITVVNGEKIFHEEAKRLISESGNWLPAIQNGKPVSSSLILIIPFRLTDPLRGRGTSIIPHGIK